MIEIYLFEASNTTTPHNLIKKITQTAVINIVFQRIFIELDVSYASHIVKSDRYNFLKTIIYRKH